MPLKYIDGIEKGISTISKTIKSKNIPDRIEINPSISFNTVPPKRSQHTDTLCCLATGQYDNIETDKLLYLSDPTEQYKFNGSHILQDNQYYIKPLADTIPRTTGIESYSSMKYNANNGISGFKVQEETLLYDLGVSEGYTWDWKRYIDIKNNYSMLLLRN